MNVLIEIANKYNRKYVTPEDVSEALNKLEIDENIFLKSENLNKVRLDLLQIIGEAAGVGVYAEDESLCAYLAWEGKK